MQTRIVGTGLFFLFIVLSGIWLSNSGRPLNTIILTIHKLIGLAALIFLAVTVHQVNQEVGLRATEWIASVMMVLFFVGAIITGGLLSTGNPMPGVILTLHQIGLFLVVLSTAATLYLLLSRSSAL